MTHLNSFSRLLRFCDCICDLDRCDHGIHFYCQNLRFNYRNESILCLFDCRDLILFIFYKDYWNHTNAHANDDDHDKSNFITPCVLHGRVHIHHEYGGDFLRRGRDRNFVPANEHGHVGPSNEGDSSGSN